MSPRAKRYTLLGSDRRPSGPSRVAGTSRTACSSPTSRPPSRPGTGHAPRACPTPTRDGRHDVVERGHFTSVLAFHFTSARSEEHTSELQSLAYLVCRLLLEKKKKSEAQRVGLHCATRNAGNRTRGLTRRGEP